MQRISRLALMERTVAMGESLVAAHDILRMQARDVLQLAALAQPDDELEAEVVRGIVQRARQVLGPDQAERH
jgi:hypothetical protein